jgi:hypothetical protein
MTPTNLIDTKFPEEYTASIFRADCEDEGSMFLQSLDIYRPHFMVSYPVNFERIIENLGSHANLEFLPRRDLVGK